MRISRLQSALSRFAWDADEQSTVDALVTALEKHKDASIQALIKKLAVVAIKDAPAKKPTSPKPTRPKPSPADVEGALKRYRDALSETFYDDAQFRDLIEAIANDNKINKAAAVQLFQAIHGSPDFDTKSLRKPAVIRRLYEKRNTRALREARTGTKP